ncbi:MAG: hypothetical protein JO227_13405 [Acetobacteraceae bacterium]|nr:hypothetical protein [Acetobacteraceae bacterium]
MKISVITPAHKHARTGNRTTAMRWARILRSLGHQVRVATVYDGAPCDLMVALHAWRSADSIRAFRSRYPRRPLIAGFGGHRCLLLPAHRPEVTRRSMASADMLVGLPDLVGNDIPEEMRGKLRVIHQSAPPPPCRLRPLRNVFKVLFIGNLREVKDPLRAWKAAPMFASEAVTAGVPLLASEIPAPWGCRGSATSARRGPLCLTRRGRSKPGATFC